ncbi:hypothetical protein PY257_15100 [Ramlibacter sp. H39-3-26]|uniref:hypothetical protein n=1 Tax=Curvibacter soli TaxID=3031331 RepID=UPI0023DC69F0|nr:hypothetical protein [Ramlibacter sp. H39-3-26]MDF1486490.1 hypothetical protein [Ramlibacter sp. H39-3-26]
MPGTPITAPAGASNRRFQVQAGGGDRTSMERHRFMLADAVRGAALRLRRWDPLHPVALHRDLAENVATDSYPGPLEQVPTYLLDDALTHAFQGQAGHTYPPQQPQGPGHCVRVSPAAARHRIVVQSPA